MTSPGRLRTWWSLYTALLLGGCALLAFTGLTVAESRAATATYLSIGSILAVGSVRAGLGGVLLDGSDLRVRSLFRTRRIPLRQIDEVRAEIIEYKILPVWAPVMQLATNGATVSLRLLAGYSLRRSSPNARVQEAVSALNRWREAAEVSADQ